MSAPDFLAIDHGSVMKLMPMSDAARDWTDEHIPEDATWFGRGVIVEPPYMPAILEGIEADGLTWNAA